MNNNIIGIVKVTAVCILAPLLGFVAEGGEPGQGGTLPGQRQAGEGEFQVLPVKVINAQAGVSAGKLFRTYGVVDQYEISEDGMVRAYL